LTDARTPTAHASSHASAGSDPLTLAQSQVTNLSSDLSGKAAKASANTFTDLNTFDKYLAATLGTPTQISSNQNNYDPGDTGVARISSDAARTITGIAAKSKAIIVLINVGAYPITLSHQSSSSTAANRIIVPNGSDAVLEPDRPLTLWYDDTTSRWRVAGAYTHRVGMRRGKLSTANYSLPGVEVSSVSTQGLSANVISYSPIYVAVPMTIDQIALEVTTQAAAGKLIRCGIFTADTDWQPVALVTGTDSGSMAADSLGVKTAALSNVFLAPGRYLLGVVSDGTPALRAFRAGNVLSGLDPALGSSPLAARWTASFTYGSLVATAWTTQTVSTVRFIATVVIREV
jgi:hypothetical protein